MLPLGCCATARYHYGMLPLRRFGRLKSSFRRDLSSFDCCWERPPSACAACSRRRRGPMIRRESGRPHRSSTSLIDVIRRVEPSVVSIARVRPNSGVGRFNAVRYRSGKSPGNRQAGESRLRPERIRHRHDLTPPAAAASASFSRITTSSTAGRPRAVQAGREPDLRPVERSPRLLCANYRRRSSERPGRAGHRLRRAGHQAGRTQAGSLRTETSPLRRGSSSSRWVIPTRSPATDQPVSAGA